MTSSSNKDVSDTKETKPLNGPTRAVSKDGISDDLHPLQRVMASSVGGLITSLMTTPLDVVKIRLQAQAKPLAHGDCYIYSSGLTDHLCVHCGAKTQPLCRHGAPVNLRYANSWVRSHKPRTVCFHSGRACVSPPVANGQLDQPTMRVTGSSVGGGFSYQVQCLLPERSSRTLYKGSVDAAVRIVRAEGVTALWSGLPPTLVMALPGTVIYYTLYDLIKSQLGFDLHATGDRAVSQAWIPPTTGAMARVAAVLILSPLELARTKLQSEALSYSFIFKSMRESIATRGIRSLWLGSGPTLLRDVPFSAIYWLVFESLKRKRLCQKLEKAESGGPCSAREWVGGQPRLTFPEAFVMGASAGCVAAVATLPFDVIKTHRQIELGEAVFSNRGQAASSTWRSIGNLYRARGALVLFTGLVPRLVKTMPACAIMISSFEGMKTYFSRRNLA